jgi:hypothetical protein
MNQNMPSRLHTVLETPEFVGGAKRVLSEKERTELIGFIAENPLAGVLIPGSGGARKLRWAAKGKGKSGGARAITYYTGLDIPVFLLAVFGKNERANISKAEVNELRQVLATIAAEYRKGAK